MRSKDGGKQWEDLYNRVGWEVYHDLYVNKRGHIFAGPFRSKDNGDTWALLNSGIGGFYIYAMNSEGHIFRGGSGNFETICHSTDDGDTWEVIYEFNDTDCERVKNMIFNPYNQIGYTECHFKTTDNGRTWYRLNTDIEQYPFGMFIVDSTGTLYSFGGAMVNYAYYMGFYRQVKDSTWEPMDTSGLNGVDKFNTMATSPNGYIYLAAHNGSLYRSTKPIVSVDENIPKLDYGNEGVKIYLNPASDKITINAGIRSAVSLRIDIYNVLGKLILSTPLERGSGLPADASAQVGGVSVDVSDLAAGAYFIQIGSWRGKFVKY